MIDKLLKKYRYLKIKESIVFDLIYFISFYLTIAMIISVSELIFYHSSIIRFKLFTILVALPLNLLFYVFIKLIINAKKLNTNMSDEKLAEEIGYKLPNIGDHLINALQLAKHNFKNKVTAALSKIAIQETRDEINNIEIKKKSHIRIKYKKIISLTYLLSIIIIITNSNSLSRIYNYNLYYPPPKPFKINSNNIIKEIPSGDNLKLEFEVINNRPNKLLLSWTENNLLNTVYLNNQSGKYNYTLENVTNNISYWASYKPKGWIYSWDSISTEIDSILILKRPNIKNINFEINPPDYTNLKNQKIDGSNAQINLIHGSTLSCNIESNQNLKSAILLSDTKDTILFNKIKNKYYINSFSIIKDQIIEIIGINQKNIRNQASLLYRINTIQDLAPEIYISKPKDRYFEINDTDPILISLQANDDFGLDKIWLEYTIIKPDYIQSDTITYIQRINENLKNEEYYDKIFKWDITKYDIFPGDQIKFRLAAKDNNPKKIITKTAYYYATYPSYEDLFTVLNDVEKNIDEASDNIIDQVSDIQDNLESMKLDLLKSDDINWSNQQKAQDSIEKMNDIISEIENMQSIIEDLKEQSKQDNLINEDLIQKFDHFQDLLDSIITPDLLDVMQQMQNALSKMDIDKMLEATKNFDYNLQQFEKQLDRFIDMFEIALAEQKLDELVTSLELLKNEQKYINQKLSEGTLPKNLSSTQNRQNKKFENFQKDLLEAQDLIKNLSEETSDNIDDLIHSTLNKQTKSNLLNAQEKMLKNDISSLEATSIATQNLDSMLVKIKEIQTNFKDEALKDMLNIFHRSISNILDLSNEQDMLNLKFEKIRSSNPIVKNLTYEQFIIGKRFTKFINQIHNLSTKTFHIKPSINKNIGLCKQGIDKTIINLEQRKITTSRNEQKNILGYMNQIALSLIESMNQAQETNSPSGLESYMEQLEQISNGQSQVNNSTMQLGQMGMLSQQEMLGRIQAEQKSLKEKLSNIISEMEGSGNNTNQNSEALSKAQEDMEQVIQDFKDQRINQGTYEKQKKILSRLLDSQKSLKQQDLSEKRKNELGLYKEYEGPLNIPEELGNKDLFFINAMEDALNQNYSIEYEKMFRKYYRELQKNETP